MRRRRPSFAAKSIAQDQKNTPSEKSDFLKNVLLVAITALFTGLFTYYFTDSINNKNREFERDKEALSDFLDVTITYADFSTVNWLAVDSLFYRPYNCDWDQYYSWDKKYNCLFQEEVFPSWILCEYWHRLQNAKTDFHIKSTKARIVGTEEIRRSILRTEQSFDRVFLEMIKSTYYMRCFVDNYNKVMKDAFNKMELDINQELSK